MAKKMVLKVNMQCPKCKTVVLEVVNKLSGVDQVMDDGKGMLTIIGDVDPVLVNKKVRKRGMFAEIVSVGPPDEPELGYSWPPPPCGCQKHDGICTIV